MRIGIVTAMAEETLPLYQKLGTVVDEGYVKGAYVRQLNVGNDVVYLAQSGVGEIRASLTAQILFDIFEVDVLLNFGFVGAVNPSLNVGDLVVAGNIVHHQFDISAVDDIPVGQYNGREEFFFHTSAELTEKIQNALPSPLPVVTVASGDKFIASREDKTYLKEKFSADICEMEAAGLALAAERNDVPFFSLKVVSDRADEGATVSFAEVLDKGLTKYEQLLPTIFKAITGEREEPLPPVKKQ